MLECVVNISEGRDSSILEALARAVNDDLLDVHSDADHNRSVFTLVGEHAPRELTSAAVRLLSLPEHEGVHPRLGVVDVVPFVPLAGSTMDEAIRARDDFAAWASGELGVPTFLYGAERSLPTVRRDAWKELTPDFGPSLPHHSAGAICVGARDLLIAYNLWLADVDIVETRRIAATIRSQHVRTLGLQVGAQTQVSMNLISPSIVGPDDVYDAVAECAVIDHAELVGLVPASSLSSIPRSRWEELDLAENRTIEWRLEARRSGSR